MKIKRTANFVIICIVLLLTIWSIFIITKSMIKRAPIRALIKNVLEENAEAKIYEFKVERLTLSDKNVSYPRFSPDGRYIAYFSNSIPTLIDITKAEEELFLDFKSTDLEPWGIKWSPNSRKVLFYRGALGKKKETLIYDLYKRKKDRLNTFRSIPAWSIDGKELIGRDIQGNICIIDERYQKRIVLPWDKEKMGGVFWGFLELMSPNKVLILSHNWKYKEKRESAELILGTINLIKLDLASSEIKIKHILFKDKELSINFYFSSLLSPDKRKFAYTITPDYICAFILLHPTLPVELFIINLLNYEKEKLTDFGDIYAFSPDSKKLLYKSIVKENKLIKWRFFIKDLVSNKLWYLKPKNAPFLFEVEKEDIDWSPDGKRLILAIPVDTNKDDIITEEDKRYLASINLEEIMRD